ncbi:hypothetical protein TanjilG_09711 [Lupinus angustifolius]|uniref:Protein kinase domain-containing protein n=1 Tax=Lupinus angustifolius TaxID=3871 RepID=A0A4P1R473_LUPAN|nr:PREDICTED: putative serine/threonine-protein kinase [Lupinus angustifolius]OIW00742.1 hypothetical protein TanjilG_09711 [Lupinus angustifolius]
MDKSLSFLHSLVKHFKFGSTSGQNNEAELQRMASQEQKIFAYETLVVATKNFNATHKLGEGGFGPVYKGKLNDGREIAVKKLSQTSNQGKKEFLNEARLLARVQHRNVVNLLGYCVHGIEKLLVYEYVPHESLDKLLFKSQRRDELDWKRRFAIIKGVAKGLLYLHEDSHNCIIHRDIKASNILLDDKWSPKIADFGMARLFPEDQSQVNTRVAGTNGYMAPEYVMHGNLSVKADVFSYGVLVLELITGQRNSAFNLDVDAQSLLDWAYKQYKKGKSLDIVDSTLTSSMEPEQVAMCIQLGLLCTQGDPQLRPNMRRVVMTLSRKRGHMDEPMRPGTPGSRYRRPRRHSAMSSTADISDSHTSNSSNNCTTCTTTATETNSATNTIEIIDPKGKRPMQG